MSEKGERFASGCVVAFIAGLYILIATFLIIYGNIKPDWNTLIPFIIFMVITAIISYKYSRRKPAIKLNRRDTFEGRYQNFVAWQKITIGRVLGENALIQIQNNNLFAEDIFRALLTISSAKANSNDRFVALIGIGHALWEFADVDGALSYYKLAKDIKPDDLIVNAELAWAYEAKNNANEAITCYEAALKDGSITEPIRAYFVSEIERVKKEGPRTVPPFTGLRLFA